MEAKANALALLSFIAFVLLIPAFIWHSRCKNIPAMCLMFWLMFNNFTTFIGACIWSKENIDTVWDGKVYCDISIKLEAGSSSGKICAIATLAFNLFMVLRAKDPWFTSGSKRRTFVNLAMCLLTPIFVMSTNYIIQLCRFLILRYRGCAVAYAASPISIALYSMWNIIWSVVALVFSALTLFEYFKKRRDVSDILKCTNSGLNFRKFARLVIFNLLVVIALVPLAIYYFVGDSAFFSGKFSWSEVHGPFWNIIYFYDYGIDAVYDRWVDIALSVIAFLLFGLGSDAIIMYKAALRKVGLGFLVDKKPKSDSGFFISQLSKNHTPLSSAAISKMSSNTRINTNNSDFRGIKKNEVFEILEETASSISTSRADDKFSKSDLEKQIESPADTLAYFAGNDVPIDEEIKCILNESMNEQDNELAYSYLVKERI